MGGKEEGRCGNGMRRSKERQEGEGEGRNGKE